MTFYLWIMQIQIYTENLEFEPWFCFLCQRFFLLCALYFFYSLSLFVRQNFLSGCELAIKWVLCTFIGLDAVFRYLCDAWRTKSGWTPDKIYRKHFLTQTAAEKCVYFGYCYSTGSHCLILQHALAPKCGWFPSANETRTEKNTNKMLHEY